MCSYLLPFPWSLFPSRKSRSSTWTNVDRSWVSIVDNMLGPSWTMTLKLVLVPSTYYFSYLEDDVGKHQIFTRCSIALMFRSDRQNRRHSAKGVVQIQFQMSLPLVLLSLRVING